MTHGSRLVVSLAASAALVAGCASEPPPPAPTFDEVGDELEQACLELRDGLRTSSVDEIIEFRRVQFEALSIVELVPAADATDEELTVDADHEILGDLRVALSAFDNGVSQLDVSDIDLDVRLAEPVETWHAAIVDIDDARDAYALDTSRSGLRNRLDEASSRTLDAMASLGLTDCLTVELAVGANTAAIEAFDRFVAFVTPTGNLRADIAAACARYELDVGLDLVDARFDGADPAIAPLVLRSAIGAALDRLLADLGRFPLPINDVDGVTAASFELKEAIDSRTGRLVSEDVTLDPEDPIGVATRRLEDALAALGPGC